MDEGKDESGFETIYGCVVKEKPRTKMGGDQVNISDNGLLVQGMWVSVVGLPGR